jgi:predicted DNA-binding antitoxin AbrB/MazE fold protein
MAVRRGAKRRGPVKEELQAVFENGVFRPLRPPRIREGEAVTLLVRSFDETEPDELLSAARAVYDGLTEKEVTEVEAAALDRGSFFGDRT